MTEQYLIETKILNYSDSSIQQLIFQRKWRELDTFEQIKSIYSYVRDEILFGYNISDKISASRVLADGYGFTIDKKLQKGAMTGLVYRNAPKNIFHSWVEVFYNKHGLNWRDLSWTKFIWISYNRNIVIVLDHSADME